MKILAESALTAKQQLTLPLAVRRRLGVKAGDSLVWKLDDRGLVSVEAGRACTLADIRAAVIAAGAKLPPTKRVSVKSMKAGIATLVRRKHALS